MLEVAYALPENKSDAAIIPNIAGNFRGTKYSWLNNIETFRG